VALGVAAITAVAWVVATGFNIGVLERVVTVLVIACPHALGLAVPLVVAINTSTAAQNGMLIRDRIAMEEARNLDTVIFDKTGTLTKGEQGVVGVDDGRRLSEERAFEVAAGVEGDSEHMIARAIRDAAEERDVQRASVSNFENFRGLGVRATVDGETVHIGGPNLIEKLGIERSDGIATFFAEEAGSNAETVIYLVHDESEVVAAFALADVIRDESRQAIEALHAMDIEVAMLTGDSEDVARAVSEELGIDQYFAEVLPEEKDTKVEQLQSEGKFVAMVGDGVNDAPALTRADVGIAIGSGTDVAIESGDIILVDNNPLDVVRLIRLSKASYRKMQENLVWATGYNVFALPLAAGILAPSASSCRRRSAPCSCRCRRSSSRSTLADWGTSTSQYLRNPQSQPCQSLRQCCSGLDSCPEGYYSVGFSFVSGASQAGSGPTAPATGRSGSGGQHGPSHS